MGLFDIVGDILGISTDVEASKSNPNAYKSTQDPRIMEAIRKRALGQATPEDLALLDAQMGKATSAVASQAASARGTNAGLAQRNATQQQAAAAQGVVGQSDLNTKQNQLQAQTLATNVAEADRQAKIKQQAIDTGVEMQNSQNNASVLGGLISGGATAGAAMIKASDEKLKKDIKPGKDRIEAFLDHISSFTYNYKDPAKDGQGEHTSVMAQDLEKSPDGKRAVIDTERGKMVDYNELLPTMLAAQAEINKRLKKLEK